MRQVYQTTQYHIVLVWWFVCIVIVLLCVNFPLVLLSLRRILVVLLCLFFVEIIFFCSNTFKEFIIVLFVRLVAIEICDTEILSFVLFQPQVFLMMAISTENSDGVNSPRYLSKIEFGIGINPSLTAHVKYRYCLTYR